MSPRSSERLAVMRERLAKRDELPEAFCRVCGGRVRAGTGVRVAEGWLDGRTVGIERLSDERRAAAGEPVVDMWRRAHEDCGIERHEIIARLAGVADITPREGELIAELDRQRLYAVMHYGFGFEREMSKRTLPKRPFDWVDVGGLKRAVDQVLAGTRPRRCLDGSCGVCGIAVSKGWTRSPLTWQDGSPAATCGPCTKVWESMGEPSEVERMRLVGLRRWIGLNVLPEFAEVFGFRCFAEIAEEEERRAGYAEPFTYRPEQLASARHLHLRRRPHLAATPEEEAAVRAEVEAERRALAEKAARDAEAELPEWETQDWSK